MYWWVRQAWSDDLRRIGLSRRSIESGSGDKLVDLSFNVGGRLVREAEIVIHIIGESEMEPLFDARQPTKQNDTLSTEGLKTYGMRRAKHTSRLECGPPFE